MLNNLWKKKTQQFRNDQAQGQVFQEGANQTKRDNSKFSSYQPEQQQKSHLFIKLQKINLKVMILAIFPFLLLIVFMFGMYQPQVNNSHAVKKTIKPHDITKIVSSQLKYRLSPKLEIIVTSSQEKYKSLRKSSNVIQNIQESLLNKTILQGKPKKQQHAKVQVNTLPLGQIAKKAHDSLQNPMYPQFYQNIFNYQPYQDLPFCLLVKQNSTDSNSANFQSIAKSIFELNYTNYITIFYSPSQNQGLSLQKLEHIQNEVLDKQYNSTQKLLHKKFYFKITLQKPTYYSYKYIIRQLCSKNSYVMFVSSKLKNDSLNFLSKSHQLYPVFLTVSQTPQMYHINSFAWRLLYLLQSNDFNFTNNQYLTKPNEQSFILASIMEISKKYARKFALNQIYDVQNTNSANIKWLSSISKSDHKGYSRVPYEYVIMLSQTFKVEAADRQKNYKEIKSSGRDKVANNKTELTFGQMMDAIVTQQTLYLPKQHSLNKRQYVQFDSNYGPMKKQQKSVPILIPERKICATVIGRNQTGYSTQMKKRFLSSFQAVLKQNYTNYHIVFYNDGIQTKYAQAISRIFKQSKKQPSKINLFYNEKTLHSLFNIIRAAFTQCSAEQIQVVIDLNVQIIGPNYFNLINLISHYNPHAWIINTNYKKDNLNFGDAYRLTRDYQYRDFDGRVKNLQFLSPISAWEVKLIRSIPLSYHLDQKGEWLKQNWHKSLQHSLSQLATVSHIQYVPQITHDVPESYYDQQFDTIEKQSQTLKYIRNKPIIRPLNSLSQKFQEDSQQIMRSIKQKVPNS